jgi:hypothetical protein
MHKLTLSVDRQVVQRAKRYANARDTSVSHLVETLLYLIATPALGAPEPPPVLARLRGALSKGPVVESRAPVGRHHG